MEITAKGNKTEITTNGIIWMLFLLLILFNVVDTTQTIMLLELKEEEANPLLAYLIEIYGVSAIVAMKMWPTALMGIALWLFMRKGENE